MTSALYVHTPVQLLPARMPWLLNRRLQPEVACQDISLEQLDPGLMKSCAEQLAEQGLTTTIHAPFSGFNPGSPKKRLRKTAHRICQQTFQLATILSPRCIVFHPGIPYQASSKEQEHWLRNILQFLPDYIDQAQQMGTIITLENIYESSPELFHRLFTELGSQYFGHCFDIGHWNIFADRDLDTWFDQLGIFVKHLHLHDNLAKSDQHLPLGAGNINFSALFERLKTLAVKPSMTLEAHNLPDLEISLRTFVTLFEG